MAKPSRIGDLLVARGLIDAASTDAIEASRAGTGLRFLSAGVRGAIISETQALEVLAEHSGVPAIDLTKVTIPPDVLNRIPQSVAQREGLVPLKVDGPSLVVAMVAPGDPRVKDEITFVTGLSVIAYVGLQARIFDVVAAAYANSGQPYKGPMARGVGEPLPIIKAPDQVDDSMMVEADIAEAAEADITPAPDVPSDPNAKRVLVIEDDPDIQRLIIDTLRSMNLAVTAASRGAEGLQLIKSVNPDLIVLDAMLPEVHGFEICRKIKESKRYSAVPVMMISAIYRGWRMAEDIKTTYKADAFLEKPFRIAELRRIAEELLKRESGEAPKQQDLSAEALKRYAAGVEAYQSQDYRTALDELRGAEQLEPFSAKVQFMLGRVLEQDQKVFQAIYHYERAIELDASLFAATKNLALLYQARGFRNKAVEMWERSLAAAPSQEVREQIKQHLVSIL